MNKLTVITINYNNCSGLSETIESVIGQTNKDFDFIVIDGGSDDGSLEVIHQYKDNLSYWVGEADNGIYHAMNMRGILDNQKMPIAAEIHNTTLSLPISYFHSENDIKRVISVMNKF